MTGKLKIVAAVLLLAGFLLILTALLSRPSAPPPAAIAPTEPVETGFPTVVARSTLPFGEPVQGDMLSIEKLPQKQEGTFSDINDVVGRIPVLTVPQGQKLTRSAFETSPLADQVRTGFRAVAIRIDEQMAGIGRLRPGDIVDVFSVFRRDDRDVNSTQSRQVLSRLRVITVGPRVVGQAEAKEGEATNNSAGAAPPMLRNVTLEVPVADVNLLLLAQQQGNLMLALRNPEDSSVANRDSFPEPVALLKKKEPKDKKAPPEPFTADDRAYAGVAMDSVVGNVPGAKPGNTAAAGSMTASRSDGAPRTRKEAADEPQKTEMIRRGKATNEVAQ